MVIRFCYRALLPVLFASQLLAAPPDTSNSLTPSIARFQLKQETIENAVKSYAESYQETQVLQQKSRARAFLQSLILPGWGQHYAESRTMMKVFAASEAIFLGSFLWFKSRHNGLEDDLRTFAATHAGVQPGGKSDSYFVDVGNYDNIFEYNQAQLRNRDVEALYPETDAFLWQWDSTENREEFEDIRVRSDRAQNRSQFTLAVIFLNHLVSAIHSSFAVYKYNQRSVEQSFHLKFQHDVSPTGAGLLSLKIAKHF